MFIANDSNYTFGQFLAVENGDDIKAPVYSKCFTDTEALKGYRFIHDPEETDPEKCVCFSIYDDVSSEATSTAFGKDAVVSDLTSVSFRLDTKILDSGKVRDVPYYHVIVPVVDIVNDTVKYLVIKMTKEVELFPENYPYYELVSTFADAEPTSAEAPGGGGGGDSDWTTATITLLNSGDAAYYASAPVFIDESTNALTISDSDFFEKTAVETETPFTYDIPLYKGKAIIESTFLFNNKTLSSVNMSVPPVYGGNISLNEDEFFVITGDCSITFEGAAN